MFDSLSLFNIDEYGIIVRSLKNCIYAGAELNSHHAVDDDLKNDLDFLTNVTRTDTFKVLGFGKGSIAHGRDSRYWDKDDRRRDDDYNEDVVEHARDESAGTVHVSVKLNDSDKRNSLDDPHNGSERKGVGLYNEAGRNELKMYEAEYEASLKSAGQSGNDNGNKNQQSNDKEFGVHSESIDVDDEYDDNIEVHGTKFEEYDDSGNGKGDHSDLAKVQNQFRGESSDFHDARKQDQNIAKKVQEASSNLSGDSSQKSQNLGNDANYKQVSLAGGHSSKASRSESKKRGRRRKFSGLFVFLLHTCVHLLVCCYFIHFLLNYVLYYSVQPGFVL